MPDPSQRNGSGPTRKRPIALQMADQTALPPTVSLRGVPRHRFGDVQALDDLTFDVPARRITVLLGPNGAGKTTAIRSITGALSPKTGDMRRVRHRPARRGRPGPAPLRRRLGQAGALRPALGLRQPALLRRALRPAAAGLRRKIVAAAERLRHRRCPRPPGRRLLDRHEDPPRPGPIDAPRSRPPALRRAHLGPRPRVARPCST
ncbi:MAG: ATP-binding cassette domain-containing protein [Microthrixaceae bacterium]